MKTVDDLKAFYDNALLPSLQELEAKRKDAASFALLLGAAAILLVAASIALVMVTKQGAWMFLGFISFAALSAVISFKCSKYSMEFKSVILKAIVEFIEPGLVYASGSCIQESDYLSSGIFPKMPDRYMGSDYVSGKVGATRMEFSELDTQYKTETTDQKGNRREEWHTIFKGIFFAADFNKNFNGKTFVLPGLPGFLSMLNSLGGQVIKMEDPEFEKYFVVHSDDQVESRYILSTSLMQRITDFRKKTNRNIHMSFVKSMVFIAVDYTEDPFAPQLFKTLIDFAPIQAYFEHFELFIGIADELNLNTRIWSKT